jgi:hypothetical protein
MEEQSLMSFVFEQAMGHIHAIRRDGTVLTGVAVGSLLLSPTFVSVNDQVKINVVGRKHRDIGQLCGQTQDLS